MGSLTEVDRVQDVGATAAPLFRPEGRSIPLQVTRWRWQILGEQMRSGHEPCFQTERRHACGETGCRWRAECLSLRADWLR